MSSSATRPGRDELARLLEEAASAYDPEGVEALIEGVLAAPAEIGTGWHVLVADPMPQALADRLEKLRAAMAAGYHDGLSVDDFARLPRSERLAGLRRELASRGLDGFIVPRADEHQGEYVPPRGQRLAWLTGFTGSAGLAIVLRDRAALFVDGRYTLQAAAQVDTGSVRDPSPDRGAAGAMARRSAQKGRGPRLRPLAAHAARGGTVSHCCRKGGRRASRASRTTRSTGFGPASRQRRSRPSCRIPSNSPARAQSRSAPDWGGSCSRRGSRRSS